MVRGPFVPKGGGLRARADVCLQMRTSVLLQQAHLAAHGARTPACRRVRWLKCVDDSSNGAAAVELVSARGVVPKLAAFCGLFRTGGARLSERARRVHGGAQRLFTTTDSISLRADAQRGLGPAVSVVDFDSTEPAPLVFAIRTAFWL